MPSEQEYLKTFQAKYRQYQQMLQARLTEKRYYHSLCVAAEALRLALKYGANPEQAYLAGLLHDTTKDNSLDEQLQFFKQFGIITSKLEKNAPKLWHAMTGAAYVQQVLGVKDSAVVSAIRYHTTARAGMTLLEKIIYLADFTSKDRDYPGVAQMRAAVDVSLKTAMYEALDFSVKDLQASGRAVHPDTLAAYQEYCRPEMPDDQKK